MKTWGEVLNENFERLREKIGGALYGALAKELTMAIKTDELEISMRLSTILKREGITTVEELSGKTREQLLRIRGVGTRTFREITSILAAYWLEQSSGKIYKHYHEDGPSGLYIRD